MAIPKIFARLLIRAFSDVESPFLFSDLAALIFSTSEKAWVTRLPACHAADMYNYASVKPGRVAQSVGRLTRKSGVLGSITGLAIYFRFSFRFFKWDSCQLLAKVCARSTG